MNQFIQPIMIFDIETVPDVKTGQHIYPQIAHLPKTEALAALIALREQEANTPFMRLPLHQIACLSFLWVENGQMILKSLSLQTHTEKEILTTFFRAFKKEKLPNLVSWNGTRFDIPVLLYRAMHHKLSAPLLFDESLDKYNNYLGRYHQRHLDLMDKLSLYGYGLNQPLDIVAGICGLAGKQDIDGTQVVGLVENQDWQTLTTYCESDVLNTWLIYLRWQCLIGQINHEQLEQFEQNTKQYLTNILDDTGKARHQSFLDAWVELP